MRFRRLQYVSQKADTPEIASATRLAMTCDIKLRSGFSADLPEPGPLDANASAAVKKQQHLERRPTGCRSSRR